ncbi:hypothetical protein [Runella slithyformis]|nr:hypothetical protein [Runella slithyformis]
MKNIPALFVYLLSLIVIPYSLKGQDSPPLFSNDLGEWKDLGFSGYISMYVADSCKLQDSICVRSCFFIKFKIDRNGNLKNISENVDAPKNLANAFKKAIFTTNGHWKPALKNRKPVTSIYLIMPVYVNLQACPPESKIDDSMYKSFTMLHNYNDNTSIEGEVCIILKPAMLVSFH